MSALRRISLWPPYTQAEIDATPYEYGIPWDATRKHAMYFGIAIAGFGVAAVLLIIQAVS